MIRRLHLVLLFLPIVLVTASHFNLDECGKGQEFACIVRDKCKGDGDSGEIGFVFKEATNYKDYIKKDVCDLHIMIKQYNVSSYVIRFITTSNYIKLEVDKDRTKFFGCKLENKKVKVEKSAEFTQINLISTKQKSGEMVCELTVSYTNDEEVFPDDQAMNVVIMKNIEERLPLKAKMELLKKELASNSFKCNPGSIHFASSKFAEGGKYSVEPIVAPYQQGTCTQKKHTMAFFIEGGEIEEAESIKCEKKVGCTAGDECKWEYVIHTKGPKKRPDVFHAACRIEICKLCTKPDAAEAKCTGDKCQKIDFSDKEACHSLKCPKSTENGEKNIVEVDGGNRTIGKFECKSFDDDKFKWTFNGDLFKSVSCYDEIDCNVYSPLKCAEKDKEKYGCPKADTQTYALSCDEESELELIERDSSDKIIKPLKVTCNATKGLYSYTEGTGNPTEINSNFYEVACKKKEIPAAEASTSWVTISIIVVLLIILVAIIVIVVCVFKSRKKKADEAKKALLKKNDSGPSSTESGKPQPSGPVHLQCSTAKQISSEQPSEATAVEKTKKEMAEKTMLEPTLDLNTAYSHDKSRQSKRETGSAEEANDRRSEESAIPESTAPKENPTAKDESLVSKKDRQTDKFKPREFALNEKEKKIAKGVWKKNTDYPTMADIESDWDDAKDGKHVSKQRTKTNEMPTAVTPSRTANKTELNEKTAEMERLLEQSDRKLQRVSEDPAPAAAASRGSDSRASVRRTSNKFTTIMTTLDATQEQK